MPQKLDKAQALKGYVTNKVMGGSSKTTEAPAITDPEELYQSALSNLPNATELQKRVITQQINSKYLGVSSSVPEWSRPTQSAADTVKPYIVPTKAPIDLPDPYQIQEPVTDPSAAPNTPVDYVLNKGKPNEYRPQALDEQGNPIWVTTTKDDNIFTYYINKWKNNALQNEYELQKANEDAVSLAKQRAQALKASTTAAMYTPTEGVKPYGTVEQTQTAQKEVAAKREELIQSQTVTEQEIDFAGGLNKFLNWTKFAGNAAINTFTLPFDMLIGISKGLGTVATYAVNAKDTAGVKLQDATLKEKIFASQVAFSTIGKGQATYNEYINRLRSGESVEEINSDMTNIVADTVLSIALDPLNAIDLTLRGAKTAKDIARVSTLVATEEKERELVRMVDKIKDLNKAQNVAQQSKAVDVLEADKIAEFIPDATLANKLQKEQDLLKTAEEANLSAWNKNRSIDEQIKVAKEAGATPEELDALKLTKTNRRGLSIAERSQKKNVGLIETQIADAKRQFELDQKVAKINTAQSAVDANKVVGENTNLPDLEGAVRDFSNTIRGWFKETDAAMSAKARNINIAGQISTAKIADVADNVKDVTNLIAKSSTSRKELGQTLTALMVMAADDVSDSTRMSAAARISISPVRSVLLSQAGQETGIVMKTMFMKGDKLDISGIEKVLEAAKDGTMSDVAKAMQGKLDMAIDLLFPSIQKRAEYVTKITELQAAGKPLPKYLERFLVDGKPEVLPKWIQNSLKARDVSGKVINPINKFNGLVLIQANPQVSFRNIYNNALTMAVDGTDPFFSLFSKNKLDRLERIHGAASGADIKMGGYQSATQEIADKLGVRNKFQQLMDKIPNNSKIEQAMGRSIVLQTIDGTMKHQAKAMFTDLFADGGALRSAGFQSRELKKLKETISETGDVVGSVKAMFGGKNNRSLSDVFSDLDIQAMGQYNLDDEALKILRNSDTPEQAMQDIDKLFDDADAYGMAAKGQEYVPLDENALDGDYSIMRGAAENDNLSTSDIDLIGRRTLVADDSLKKSKTYLQKIRDNIEFALRNTPNQKIDEMNRIGAETSNIANSVEAKADRLHTFVKQEKQKILKDILGRIKRAEELNQPDTIPYLWMEYKGKRQELYAKLIQDQLDLYKQAGLDLQATAKGLKLDPVDDTFVDVLKEQNRQWAEDIDEELFAMDHLPKTKTGEILNTPVQDSLNTSNDAVKEAAPQLLELRERAKAAVSSKWSNLEVTTNMTAEQEKALSEVIPILRKRYADSLAVSYEVANEARKFTMLDYRDKTGLDLAAAYVYPYQYWYSRSYKNWMDRIVQHPGLIVGYLKYREAMEKINAQMPEWYRYQIQIGSLIGVDLENPLFFNIETTLNPLNGIMGVDYNDPRRQTDALPALVDTMGKFGPSVHTMWSYGIAAYYALKGDSDTAEAWGGRLIPATKLVKDFTGMVGVKAGHETPVGIGKNRFFTPMGVELDPIVSLAMGGIENGDSKRAGRKLAEMVERGDCTEEQAIDAAMNHTGKYWDTALDYAQNDPNMSFLSRRSTSGFFGGIFGTGFKGRSQGDILIDKAYSEYNNLYALQPNLSPSAYRQEMLEMFEKYPFLDLVILSRKKDNRREQAYAYNVLDRISPGKLSYYTTAYGLDSRLVDKFYTDKGRIDLWGTSDRERFMSFIADAAAVVAIPPTATQHDWNTVTVLNQQLNEALQLKYGDNILDLMGTYWDLGSSKDYVGQQALLSNNPQLEAAMNDKTQTTLTNPTLKKYYGGVEKLRSYLEYQKRGRAQELFGEDIFDKVTTYQTLKDMGAEGLSDYVDDNKALQDYFDWNEGQKDQIEKHIEQWGRNLPASSMENMRPDALLQTIGAQDLAQALQETNVAASLEADMSPYMTKRSQTETTGDLNLTRYIEEEADKRWKGVVDRYSEYLKTAMLDKPKASQMWLNDPTLSMYDKFKKGLTSSYNEAKEGNITQSDAIMKQTVQSSMSASLYRIATAYARGAELSASSKKQLTRIANKLGITFNQLIMYVIE